MLSDDDIFEHSITLQKEGSDLDKHDSCLLRFINTFGDAYDKYYGLALIELNQMIEIF